MLERARATAAYDWLQRHPTLHQFVRFATVGSLNVALYLLLFNWLLWLGLHTLAANAAAFLITSVNSFVLNKVWAFKDQRRHAIVRQYLLFVVLTLVGLAINTAALSLFLLPLERYGTFGKNLSALGAIPFSVVWNFNAYRRWTFPGEQRRADAAS